MASNLSTSTSDSESPLLHPTSAMSRSQARDLWGVPPWQIDFTPPKHLLPSSVDFAIVGAGFAGLAAAAWLRILAPEKSVIVLEAGRIGNGASGRTGGLVLSESAAGDLPGLGDVLAGLKKILRKLGVESDLLLPGAWEIAHSDHAKRSDNARPLKGRSSIQWRDFNSQEIRVTGTVPGGTLDPGKQVSGLARAAARFGAVIAKTAAFKRSNGRIRRRCTLRAVACAPRKSFWQRTRFRSRFPGWASLPYNRNLLLRRGLLQ